MSQDESSPSPADHFQLGSTAALYGARVGYHPDAVRYALRAAYRARFHTELGENQVATPLRILDAGVGTGQLTEAVKALNIPVEIFALDNSHPMLIEFRKAHPDVPPVEASISQLPFADGSFDAVLLGTSLHWGDPQQAPQEVLRVLRPGGALISLNSVHEPDSDYHRLIHHELTSVLDDNPMTEDVIAGGRLKLGNGYRSNRPKVFQNPTPMEPEQLRQLLRSLAGLARAPREVQARAWAGAERLLARPENAQRVVVPGRTIVHVANARRSAPRRKGNNHKKQGPT